jgi:N-methylhydantoinase A
MSDIRLSSDIGGTFTDIVLDVHERRFTHKILTTPDAPESGLLAGIDAVLLQSGVGFREVDVFIHGTTLATNAIIERRGAKTALVATEGFRDILVIGTESRYDQYDLYLEKPRPLVPRELRFTVRERMDARGCVYLPLAEPEVTELAADLQRLKVESVAIAFLHSYLNPAHEKRAAEILGNALPGVTITTSSAVCPEVREYERTSTAVANAYVQPIMAGYLRRMSEALGARGFKGTLYIVTSGGGLTSLETAISYPVRLVESGPAGGAIFASLVANQAHEQKVLSFDMGGTTAKICLIENGEPTTSRSFEVDRMARFLKGSGIPLRIPVIEMVEIGAGGGSIAKVDQLKRVTVGPESASSVPGPACYGRGGKRPTVTDADVTLGLIEPTGFAGGSFDLHPELAERALNAAIGHELAMSPQIAAYAVYETVCENMSSAARVHAAERGAALSEFAMIAFGGAAPLHAARVADKVGVRRVIIPVNAGVGSAVGFLTAPVSYEIVQSRPTRIDDSLDATAISSMLDDMARDARNIVAAAAGGQALTERRIAFMRYVGQGHEIAVQLPDNNLDSDCVREMRVRYEAEYSRQFSRVIPHAAIEVMSWAVQATTPRSALAPVVTSHAKRPATPSSQRPIYQASSDTYEPVPVYLRQELQPGDTMHGPCLIVEDETTTFVPDIFCAHIDGLRSIVLDRQE